MNARSIQLDSRQNNAAAGADAKMQIVRADPGMFFYLVVLFQQFNILRVEPVTRILFPLSLIFMLIVFVKVNDLIYKILRA